ncbi:hypothetical protein [Ruminococcus sp.]|uniref:hypothetical protein n=1 Tax=Ruminococcus sp. TaxID=41978 RepID=UPI0026010085|nr:hypothetical protein [Ruminococcus sp.]MBR0512300.1 hypothetical protein [Ruminococcus sp.]MCR4640325.1 hypothetical protein [Ruminococcus sp.]
MDYIDILKNTIDDNMTLPDIVNAFEKMCEEPIDNDMILFETGTFSFTGEPMFYFSLVRQFPNDDGEYYQLHADIMFKPNDVNKEFSDTVWDTDINGNIFDHIRSSKAYGYAMSDRFEKIDIYMDET